MDKAHQKLHKVLKMDVVMEVEDNQVKVLDPKLEAGKEIVNEKRSYRYMYDLR
jgi:hypothetical protein